MFLVYRMTNTIVFSTLNNKCKYLYGIRFKNAIIPSASINKCIYFRRINQYTLQTFALHWIMNAFIFATFFINKTPYHLMLPLSLPDSRIICINCAIIFLIHLHIICRGTVHANGENKNSEWYGSSSNQVEAARNYVVKRSETCRKLSGAIPRLSILPAEKFKWNKFLSR